MISGRLERISQIYQAALEVAEEDRTSFLEQVCQGDEELRREVESLLAYEERADGFIDGTALQVSAENLAAESASLINRKIGPYQIVARVGAGGMGEVYRATDTRLNRTVAIKVLSTHQSLRPEMRKRFEQEAKAISNLNHPHICTLYDIGQADGLDFLVMEYLEGETLSRRLRKGPLPLDQVLRYSVEIASALDQAHRKGVIHRDLKPGNIMLTETGAKLLDFGLAKRSGGAGLGEAGPGPTAPATESLTEEGMILGTLEYMAPEQVEGKQMDARTDLFALGVVMYEMATGRKAFEGDSKASVIAKILTTQPPLISTIEPLTPTEFDQIVQRCLAKKPEERWQTAAEVTRQLQKIAESPAAVGTLAPSRKSGSRHSAETTIEAEGLPAVRNLIREPRKTLAQLVRSRAWQLGFIGFLLAVVAGSVALWRMRQKPEKPAESSNEISFRPLTSNSSDNPLENAAISPDGKYLAYTSIGKLYIQVISSKEKRFLLLPEGFYASGVYWFPDGTKLLLRQAERKWFQKKGQWEMWYRASLWTVSILGGLPQKIVDDADSGPASVSPDGSQVAFSRFDLERQTLDIWVVNANGEAPRKIRAPTQPNQNYASPIWSLNGQRLFYYVSYDNAVRTIESCNLRGEGVTTALSSKFPWETHLSVGPDERIFFSMVEKGEGTEASNLWEIKVDPVTGRALSPARRLTQDSAFSAMGNYVTSITADGKRLVFLRFHFQADIFVAEAEAGGKSMKNLRRLTLDESNDEMSDWTADSRSVLFVSNRNGKGDIFKQDIGKTEAEPIVVSPEEKTHPIFSPDQGYVLYLVSPKRYEPATRLMRIPVNGGPPEQVLSGDKILNFSCAREAKRCVVEEWVDGKLILSTFDPAKGRGEKLTLSDLPYFEKAILSPQGRFIEKMRSGPDGLHVRVGSLTGGTAQEFTFKDLVGNYEFETWSLDGKGMYISDWVHVTSGDHHKQTLYVSLDGHSQVFWKRGRTPASWIHYPFPSPNGRYLAFTVGLFESNAWLMENF